MWNGLNAVHQTAKHAFDTRYFPFNASYLNDGFAVVDEWEQDHERDSNGGLIQPPQAMPVGTSDGWSGAALSVAEHAGRDVRRSARR